MPPASVASPVRVDAVLATCLAAFAVGLAVEYGWRWLCLVVLDVPATVTSLETSSLVLNAVIPVAGNGLGYVLSYRHRSRRSLLVFVGPSAVLTGVGITAAIALLPPAPGPQAIAVTVVLVLITPVVVVAMLLAHPVLLPKPAADPAG